MLKEVMEEAEIAWVKGEGVEETKTRPNQRMSWDDVSFMYSKTRLIELSVCLSTN